MQQSSRWKTIEYDWSEVQFASQESCKQTCVNYRVIIRLIPLEKNQKNWLMMWLCPKIQYSYCLKCWTEGIVYCTQFTYLIFTQFILRRMNRHSFITLTIHEFLITKGARYITRHGKNRDFIRVSSSEGWFKERFKELKKRNLPAIPTKRYVQRIATCSRRSIIE